jgi:hypothetical protein
MIIYYYENNEVFNNSEVTMTNSTYTNTRFLTTQAGARIPKLGTIAYHETVGFGEVIGRSGGRLRIKVAQGQWEEDTFQASRRAEFSEVSNNSAELEIAHLEHRLGNPDDPFYQARGLVNGMIDSIISRTVGVNEMLVNLDGAEHSGWEFDDYYTVTEKFEPIRAKAPAPRPRKQQASRAGTLQDDARPDWLVAELNETFGDYWTAVENAHTNEAVKQAFK